ncbi:MAG: restriction endonuclease subunit S [Cyanobacteria bacterium J06581_3]
MVSKWQKVTIEDCLEAIIDYRGMTPPKTEKGIPTLTAANIKKGRIDLSSVSYISQETYDSWITRGLPEPNDVLITTEAPVGEVAPFPSDQTYLITRRVMALRPNPQQLDKGFLLYLLLNPKTKETLLSRSRGSTVPRVLKPDITGLEICLPDLRMQKKIANILCTLDKKNELNRRMNRTLEVIAQAIFKSWFVNFEPVKAKQQAKAAGKSVELAAMMALSGKSAAEIEQLPTAQRNSLAETAALFPERLVESELGLIPEGWEIGNISDLFELHRGFDLAKSKRVEDGTVPVYSAGGIHSNHNEIKITAPGVVTGRSGVIGNVFISLEDFWPLNTTLYVREFRACGPYYAFHFLQTLDLIALNSGSAVPSLNRNFVHSQPTKMPPTLLRKKFEEHAEKLFLLIKQNECQSKCLADTRDALLPKLLSGELTVEAT